MPALIPVSLLCVFYFQFINKIFTPAKRGYERLSSKNKAPIYSHFQESILGQSTIRAFKKTDEFTVKERTIHWQNLLKKYSRLEAMNYPH